jgi:hemoglobin
MDVRVGETPLFERLGGFAAVSRVVSDFYVGVLDSDLLAPWFETTDMRRLIDHQTKFMAALMGGPAAYTDEALRRAHVRLRIDRAAFDEMKRILAETLGDHGVNDVDLDGVMREIERCAPCIVSA